MCGDRGGARVELRSHSATFRKNSNRFRPVATGITLRCSEKQARDGREGTGERWPEIDNWGDILGGCRNHRTELLGEAQKLNLERQLRLARRQQEAILEDHTQSSWHVVLGRWIVRINKVSVPAEARSPKDQCTEP